MSNPRFVVRKVNWWEKPIPLMRKIRISDGLGDFRWEKVGWVWNQEAYLVNNLSFGWFAPLEDQTQTNLEERKLLSCEYCKHEFSFNKRDKLKAYYDTKANSKN